MTQQVRRKPGPKPGTGSKGDREAITVRVPKGSKKRLAAIAETRGAGSISELACDVLLEWLPQAEASIDDTEELDLKMA